jgi:hypothetical protein
MSKKTIAIQIPQKPAPKPESRELATLTAQAETGVEQWVRNDEPTYEASREGTGETPVVRRAGAITFTLSAEPNLLEAVKFGLVGPYAAFWLWSLAATRRNMRLFGR